MRKLPDELMKLVDLRSCRMMHVVNSTYQVVDNSLGIIVYTGTADECEEFMRHSGIVNASINVEYKIQRGYGDKWMDEADTIGMTYEDAKHALDHNRRHQPKFQWRLVETQRRTEL